MFRSRCFGSGVLVSWSWFILKVDWCARYLVLHQLARLLRIKLEPGGRVKEEEAREKEKDWEEEGLREEVVGEGGTAVDLLGSRLARCVT